MKTHTTGAEFFETMYSQQADPWNFASSTYEQSRYETIYRAFAHRQYRQAFEPGCSIGILTERLASCCEQVEALDISATAVATAKKRCSHLKNVSIRCASLSEVFPENNPDLLILSEIGYYFEAAAWRKQVETLLHACSKPATLIAAHWLGFSADHILSGDCVHETIDLIEGLTLEHRERHEGFRLDRWCWQ